MKNLSAIQKEYIGVVNHPEDLTFSKCGEEDTDVTPEFDVYYKLHPEEKPETTVDSSVSEQFLKMKSLMNK